MAFFSPICVSSENIQFYRWVFVLKFSKESNLHDYYNSDFSGPKINYGNYDNFCPFIPYNRIDSFSQRKR